MNKTALVAAVVALGAGGFLWFRADRTADSSAASLQPEASPARETPAAQEREALTRPSAEPVRSAASEASAKAASKAPPATDAKANADASAAAAEAALLEEKQRKQGLANETTTAVTLEDSFATKYEGRSSIDRSSALAAIEQLLADAASSGKSVNTESISALKEEAEWLRNHPEE